MCKHADPWMIGGGSYHWCWRCGAIRPLRFGLGTEPDGRWVGPADVDPWPLTANWRGGRKPGTDDAIAEEGRIRKAAAIARELESMAGPEALRLARDATAKERLWFAEKAGQKQPSDLTWDRVVQMLEMRESRREPPPF